MSYHNLVPVPVYGRTQRDRLWAEAAGLLPRLQTVGRDEIVSNDLVAQGLRFLVQNILGEGSALERFHRDMGLARRHDLEEVEVRVPVYNRARRDVIYAAATKLFPALLGLERDEVVAADIVAHTLRICVEAVYMAEADHDARALHLPRVLAMERFERFQVAMRDASSQASIPLAEAA